MVYKVMKKHCCRCGGKCSHSGPDVLCGRHKKLEDEEIKQEHWDIYGKEEIEI